MEEPAVARCQKIIDYQFRTPSLLRQALTHASVSATRLDSNERLEFLGDAILGLCVCAALYEQYEDLPEYLKEGLKVIFVEEYREVFKAALGSEK